jgi:hypothetical protein
VKVIVHYPQTEQGKEKLKRAVTDVHIDAVIKHISTLNCPKEQKEKLLSDIIKYWYDL